MLAFTAITLLASVFTSAIAKPVLPINVASRDVGSCDSQRNADASPPADVSTTIITTTATTANDAAPTGGMNRNADFSDVPATVGMNLNADFGENACGDGCVDLDVWASDLRVSTSAAMDLFDGTSDPSPHCQDLINTLKASMNVLANSRTSTCSDNSVVMQAVLYMFFKMYASMAMYPFASLFASMSVLVDLYGCLVQLTMAISVHINGFMDLCMNQISAFTAVQVDAMGVQLITKLFASMST